MAFTEGYLTRKVRSDIYVVQLREKLSTLFSKDLLLL